jgi:hypothetical protein
MNKSRFSIISLIVALATMGATGCTNRVDVADVAQNLKTVHLPHLYIRRSGVCTARGYALRGKPRGKKLIEFMSVWEETMSCTRS